MIATQSIDELNGAFAIDGVLAFEAGEGGLTRAAFTAQGAAANVYTLGAHVTHWRPPGHEPVLWMSGQSWFEPGKPIRGGVPVCLPWFNLKPDDPDAPRALPARPRNETREIAGMPSARADAGQAPGPVAGRIGHDDAEPFGGEQGPGSDEEIGQALAPPVQSKDTHSPSKKDERIGGGSRRRQMNESKRRAAPRVDGCDSQSSGSALAGCGRGCRCQESQRKRG